MTTTTIFDMLEVTGSALPMPSLSAFLSSPRVELTSTLSLRDKPVLVEEVARLLTRIDLLYTQLAFEMQNLSEQITPGSFAEVAQAEISRIREKPAQSYEQMFHPLKYLSESRETMGSPRLTRLTISKISYNSPLELILYGFAPALLVALVVSGGRVKLPFVEAELKPLGDGLKKIRTAVEATEARSEAPRKKTIQVAVKKREISSSDPQSPMPNLALQPTRYGVPPLTPGHALRAFWPGRSWRHAYAVGLALR